MGSSQQDFAYPSVGYDSGSEVLVCAGPALLADLAEDLPLTGLSLGRACSLADLAQRAAMPERAFLEVRDGDPEALALLAECDARLAAADSRVVVATTLTALDAVFGTLDRTDAQFLVEPDRAERIAALARLARDRRNGSSVREFDAPERQVLATLLDQMAGIASRLDSLGLGGKPTSPATDIPRTGRRPRDPLPDPRFVRAMIRRRQARGHYFPAQLFADPAWDILLDLAAARAEHARVSVTSLCIAAGVPPTTALRWITQMVDAGLLERQLDPDDKRRAFIALTDPTAAAMARYFAEIGTDAIGLA